jgi:hypothetical protein
LVPGTCCGTFFDSRDSVICGKSKVPIVYQYSLFSCPNGPWIKKPPVKTGGEFKQGGFTSGRRKESPKEVILSSGIGPKGRLDAALQHPIIGI